jgi:hypothetical protein
MKFIYPNNGVLSSASSELDSAPAANITESHANNSWLADTEDLSPSITIEVSSGSAVLIYKIAAEAITVTVRNSVGTTIKTQTWDLAGPETYGVEQHTDHVWLEYPEQTGTHTITAALTRGSYLYSGIGIMCAGKLRGPFTDPNFGELSAEAEDYSLIIQLSGGVEHAIQDNIQRICPATLQIVDSEEADAFMRLGNIVGKNKPCGCKLHDSATPEANYLIYARFDAPPKMQLTAYKKNTMTFTLREFL